VATSLPFDTSDTSAYRRRLALAMAQEGTSTAPVGHWTQGLARMTQALVAAQLQNQIAMDEGKTSKELQAARMEMLGINPATGTASPVSDAGGAAPSPQMVAALAQPGTRAMNTAPGKIYENDEPSPLDPPDGASRDLMARIIAAEADRQPQVGQDAVANVIRTRAVHGGYGGNTTDGVITKPYQFEPMNTAAGRARMAAFDPQGKAYQNASQAIDNAYFGSDPTNGATHFIEPVLQQKLGRPIPGWAQGPGQFIGDHKFIGGVPQSTVAQAGLPPVVTQGDGSSMAFSGQPAQPAPAPAAPPPPQQAQPQLPAGILKNLQHPTNQRIREEAYQQAQQYLKKQQGTDEIREYEYAQRNPGFKDYKTELKRAGSIQNNVNIDQKAENAFSVEASKSQAKRFDEIATEGPKARQLSSDVETLRTLSELIGTGKSAEAKAIWGPYAQTLGVDVKGLSAIQAFDSIVSRVAPTLRVPGSGAQSDFELKKNLQSLLALGNTPEGNEMISKTMQGVVQTKQTAAEIASKALSGEIKRSDAEKMLRELPDPMTEFREAMKKQKSESSTVTVDGYKIKAR
jgi:spore germination cell wall hydrolase CwlJ-like protein